jgi:protoheme IX farnesyltransferase
MKEATLESLQQGTWKDYFWLMKPRTVLLHLVTAATSMFLAAKGSPPISILLFVLIGGGLMASASNVLNCFFDRDIDKLMERTHSRPLPAGRISPSQALIYSALLGLAGFFVLTRFVNLVVAMLALGALLYYILIYTLWLKRRTCWSSIIGSGIGAFPTLIGWYAVIGRFEATPLLLSATIIFWTAPHFWSLVIFQQPDYNLAGIKAIPTRNVRGWIGCFSWLLVGTSLAIKPVAHLSSFYLGTASILGIILIVLVGYLQYKKDSRSARQLYWYSVIYLTVLFASLLVESLVF